LWSIFLAFGLLMWLSRVMIIVHWPTDVIAWFAVWVLIPILLFQKPIYKILKKILINPIINFQKLVWWLFGVKY
jgi:membrane-associated phospholipid phosphatase